MLLSHDEIEKFKEVYTFGASPNPQAPCMLIKKIRGGFTWSKNNLCTAKVRATETEFFFDKVKPWQKSM